METNCEISILNPDFVYFIFLSESNTEEKRQEIRSKYMEELDTYFSNDKDILVKTFLSIAKDIYNDNYRNSDYIDVLTKRTHSCIIDYFNNIKVDDKKRTQKIKRYIYSLYKESQNRYVPRLDYNKNSHIDSSMYYCYKVIQPRSIKLVESISALMKKHSNKCRFISNKYHELNKKLNTIRYFQYYVDKYVAEKEFSNRVEVRRLSELLYRFENNSLNPDNPQELREHFSAKVKETREEISRIKKIDSKVKVELDEIDRIIKKYDMPINKYFTIEDGYYNMHKKVHTVIEMFMINNEVEETDRNYLNMFIEICKFTMSNFTSDNEDNYEEKMSEYVKHLLKICDNIRNYESEN